VGLERFTNMTDHNFFYYPYACFTNARFPLLKVAALYVGKLVLLDPVSASRETSIADRRGGMPA
jgi:hypothetical protein